MRDVIRAIKAERRVVAKRLKALDSMLSKASASVKAGKRVTRKVVKRKVKRTKKEKEKDAPAKNKKVSKSQTSGLLPSDLEEKRRKKQAIEDRKAREGKQTAVDGDDEDET